MLNIVAVFNQGRWFGKFKSRKSPKKLWRRSWKSQKIYLQNEVAILNVINYDNNVYIKKKLSNFFNLRSVAALRITQHARNTSQFQKAEWPLTCLRPVLRSFFHSQHT